MNFIVTLLDPTKSAAKSVFDGDVQVHSERSNGTFRRRHFLVRNSEARATAEWVRAQREGQDADEAEGIEAIAPRTMASIAKEMHVSVSAVRRILVDLAVTEELEDMDNDEIEAILVGGTEAEVTIEDQA
jgi:hypothetical protein